MLFVAGETLRCLRSVIGTRAGGSVRQTCARQPPDGGSRRLLADAGSGWEEWDGGTSGAHARRQRLARRFWQRAPPSVVAVPRHEDLMFGPLRSLPLVSSVCCDLFLRVVEHSEVFPHLLACVRP